mgnify:FL=1
MSAANAGPDLPDEELAVVPSEAEVLAHQTRLLYGNLPSILAITSLVAILLVGTYHDIRPGHWAVQAWAALFGVILFIRLGNLVAYRRAQPGPEAARPWYRRYAALTALSGSIWGASGWVFYSDAAATDPTLLTFIVAGLGAGGVVNLAPRWQCAWLFIVPATLPFMVRFMTLDTSTADITAALIGLFIAALMAMSYRLSSSTREHIVARLTLAEQFERSRRDQQRYQSLVESASAMIWESDPDTFRFTYVSPEAESLLGYTPDQWTGDPDFWPEHIHPDDREWAMRFCSDATRRLEKHEFDYRMIAADGRVVWLRDVVSVVVRNGRPDRLVGVMIDITTMKNTQRDLEYVAGLQRLLVEVSRRLFDVGEQELDRALSKTLERIGQWCCVDRAYVMRFAPDLESYSNTHEWVADGITREIDSLQNVPSSTIPVLLERLNSKRPAIVSRVDELEPAWVCEKQLFESQSIRSLLSLPIFTEGRLVGLIGFDSVRSVRDWGSEEVALLQGLGDLIGVAMERADRQRKLRDSEALRREAEALAGMGSWEWELGSERFRASREWRNVSGCGSGELTRGQVLALTPEPDRQRVEKALRETIERGVEYCIEHRIVRPDNGEERWVEVHARLQTDDSGRRRLRGFAQDVTDRKHAEDKLYNLAHYDNLTGLPNRVLVLDRLSQALKRSRRRSTRLALLFIDLDDFKKVNDTLGHDAGDQLLVESAERLLELFRERDTVARIGGDEFLVVLEEFDGMSDVVAAASRLLAAFRRPFVVRDRTYVVTASAGIAVAPEDGDSADELMRKADTAMYHAKHKGRDEFQFFTPAMNESIERQLEIEQALGEALAKRQLSLRYQPIVRLSDRRCVAAEALLRWSHPDLGDIPPDEFIPVAERSGHIEEIGRFVIGRAIEDLVAWRSRTEPGFRVSINVSPRQFRDGSIAERIIEELGRADLPGAALEIEVTEGLLLSERVEVRHALERLRGHGVGLVMDDFGSGYASLGYLRDYPFSSLKIDRSFVSRLDSDSRHRKLVVSAIRLGKALEMQVIAEGVETEQELSVLEAEGCELVQGYLFGRPIMAESMIRFLDRRSPEVED